MRFWPKKKREQVADRHPTSQKAYERAGRLPEPDVVSYIDIAAVEITTSLRRYSTERTKNPYHLDEAHRQALVVIGLVESLQGRHDF